MTDVYKVGVVLSLTNGISPALRLIQGDLGTFVRTVDRVNNKVGNLGKNLVAAGVASTAMGAGFLAGAEKILKAGDKMQQQIARMKGLGVRPDQLPLNQQAAWAAANSMFNVAPQGAMETLSMLRGLLGNSPEARGALVPVLKAQVGLDAQLGGKAGSGLITALKALDISGGMIKGTHISVSKLTSLLPYIEQAMIQLHGMLTGPQILRMMQQAGPAATATSFKNLLMDTMEAVSALGPAVGRGLFTSYMVASVGRASAVSAHYLSKLGLVPAAAMHKIKGSSTYLFDPDKMYASAFLQKQGFLTWLHDKVIPLLRKRGDDTNQKLVRDIAGAFPSSTSARTANWVVYNWPQRDRAAALVENGVKNGDPYAASMTTWSGATSNFFKALEGLMTALGQPSVGNAVGYLNQFSDAIHRATGWLSKHPGYAKVIVLTLTALGAAFVALGVALAAAGVVALLGAGGTFAALAAGVGVVAVAFAALNWKAVSEWISHALHVVGDAILWLLTPIGKALDFISKLPLDLFPKHLREQGSGVGNTLNPWAHPDAGGGAPISKGGMTIPGMGSAVSSYFSGNGGHWVDHGGFQTWSPGPPPVTSAHGGPKGTANDPIHTMSTVTNPSDIHNGTAKALNSQLNGRQNGPSGFDYSFGAAIPAGAY